MAENVDVNINAKVTGGDDVKQLGDDTKKAAGAAQSLKAQIRETTQAIQKSRLVKTPSKMTEALFSATRNMCICW